MSHSQGVARSTTSTGQSSAEGERLSLPREELRIGARGPAVKALQQALVKLGHLPAWEPGSVDGDFGPKTEAALKIFQSTEHLPMDGAYGARVREALERRMSAAPGQVSGVVVPLPPPGVASSGLSLAQLCAIMPRLKREKAEQYLPFLNAAMAEAEIHTPLRRAAFLAQLAHESGQLRYFEEVASGEAYEGRKDLGNVQPGDGVRYKGRGPIQLTGRNNYRKAGQALGFDLEGLPQRAADPDLGFRVAGWFWKSNGLNALADASNFDTITRRINGGFNGKADREAYYRCALQVLGIGQPLKDV